HCVSCRASLILLPFSFPGPRHHRNRHSFPTRRSSDLEAAHDLGARVRRIVRVHRDVTADHVGMLPPEREEGGIAGLHVTGRWEVYRKSTRLNSSHVSISYAVFCLKKKKVTVCCFDVSQ